MVRITVLAFLAWTIATSVAILLMSLRMASVDRQVRFLGDQVLEDKRDIYSQGEVIVRMREKSR